MSTLFLLNAALDFLLASVVLRAQWSRRENQLLGISALVEAMRDAAIGLLLRRGYEPTGDLPVQIGLLGRIVVLYPILLFMYGFPAGRRPPSWVTWLARGILGSAAVMTVHPATVRTMESWAALLLLFVPFFLAILWVMRTNLAQVRSDDAARAGRWCLFVMMFRFATELITHALVRPLWPDFFPMALKLNVITEFLTFGVVVDAVLRHRFFRVRSVLAAVVLYATLSVTCLTVVIALNEFAAEHLQHSILRGAAFCAVALVPLAAWNLTSRYAGRLETAILLPFDPRGRSRERIVQRALQETSGLSTMSSLVEATERALVLATGGRATRWICDASEFLANSLEGPLRELPMPIREWAEHAPGEAIHRGNIEELPEPVARAFEGLSVDVVVPVRVGERIALAFGIVARAMDRAGLDAALALAQNLGHKLAIQELHQQAIELQSQLEKARYLSTLGSFAAAIAHDVRTPLTSIKMNLEMIRTDEALSTELQQNADLALEELERLNDYVRSILYYAKPLELREVTFDVAALLKDAVRTLQPVLESRQLEVRCVLAESQELPAIRGDSARMKQALLNLLENAADASALGGVIELSAGLIDEQLFIRVVDAGQGIEPDVLPRIFEPFFTTRDDGTGLGLAIARKLVAAHGGELSASSKLGVGSSFTILLPCARVRPATNGADPRGLDVPPVLAADPRWLV